MPYENELVHVIDDDEAVRESLAFLLRAARIEVQTIFQPVHSSTLFQR